MTFKTYRVCIEGIKLSDVVKITNIPYYVMNKVEKNKIVDWSVLQTLKKLYNMSDEEFEECYNELRD